MRISKVKVIVCLLIFSVVVGLKLFLSHSKSSFSNARKSVKASSSIKSWISGKIFDFELWFVDYELQYRGFTFSNDFHVYLVYVTAFWQFSVWFYFACKIYINSNKERIRTSFLLTFLIWWFNIQKIGVSFNKMPRFLQISNNALFTFSPISV